MSEGSYQIASGASPSVITIVSSCDGRHNNGMQRSADTTALMFSKGAARPLMPGVRCLLSVGVVSTRTQMGVDDGRAEHSDGH